jgi:HD-like signal output (HDOD) protein
MRGEMETIMNLIRMIDKFLRDDKFELPLPGAVYQRLQGIMVKKNPDLWDLEKPITFDQSLTIRVIRMANSAFYRGFQKVTTVREAIMRLGSNEVINILLPISQRENFSTQDPWLSNIMHKLFQHSVASAVGAQWIAKNCRFRFLQQEAFIAGLLHDVGKNFLVTVIERIKLGGSLAFPLNEELIGQALATLHAEDGYFLLTKWGLPEKYRSVARNHHKESLQPDEELLAMVRLANRACHKAGIGLKSDPSLVLSARPEVPWLALSEAATAALPVKIEESLALTNL